MAACNRKPEGLPWWLSGKDSTSNAGAARRWRVRSLGWEDPLEEGMATHSSILAWTVSTDRGAWWASVYGVAALDTTEAT